MNYLNSSFHVTKETITWLACVSSWSYCAQGLWLIYPTIMRPFYFFCEQLSNVFPLQRPFATKLRAQCASLTPHRVGAFALHVLFSISFGSKQVIFKYLALPSESQYICPVDQSPVAPGYTQNPFLVFCWPSQASPWHCGAPGRVKGFVFCRGGTRWSPRYKRHNPPGFGMKICPSPLRRGMRGQKHQALAGVVLVCLSPHSFGPFWAEHTACSPAPQPLNLLLCPDPQHWQYPSAYCHGLPRQAWQGWLCQRLLPGIHFLILCGKSNTWGPLPWSPSTWGPFTWHPQQS